MTDELAAALAPVLRDLARPDGVRLEVRDDPRVGHVQVFGPDGSGMGIWVELGAPAAEQVVFVADKVQEWAVEALWSLGRSATWPQCPHHPDSHPLTAVERDGRAVWVCPVLGDEIREIGG